MTTVPTGILKRLIFCVGGDHTGDTPTEISLEMPRSGMWKELKEVKQIRPTIIKEIKKKLAETDVLNLLEIQPA